jgi:membrane-bound lytic murein transglycosylase D
MKKILLALLVALTFQSVSALPTVPEHMRFCDIELTIDAAARTKIEEVIVKLQRSPVHFQSLVDRANIYFPFIEEAFDLRGVPQDLKYIVIQESAMVADAVSSSNAVGFWQFKAESGRESGLAIDEYVDERKHIFQSSLGAAKYFYTIARYYDNYLYAVIGYNRGPVGALPFTEERGYGNHRMTVTGETHWYAIHALAHKIAFENALGKTPPPLWLQPLNTHGETDVSRLAAAQDMNLEDFKKYNAWINGSKLPEGRDFIYYVPRKGKPELALMRHVGSVVSLVVTKQVGGHDTVKPLDPPKEKPKPADPVTPAPRDNRKFDYLESDDDPTYGTEYVRFKPGESLVELAVHNDVRIKKLQSYNDFTNYHRPNGGDIVYLKPAKSRHFHIVQAGESLGSIAEMYATTTEKLQEKNRMKGTVVFAGQKLSLKKRVAKGQKPILLALSTAAQVDEVTAVEENVEEEVDPKHDPIKTTNRVVLPPGAGAMKADASSYRLPAFESKIVVHTVAPNESVWKVARKYGAYADVIKKLNNLSSNELKAGQQLKVLQVTDRK